MIFSCSEAVGTYRITLVHAAWVCFQGRNVELSHIEHCVMTGHLLGVTIGATPSRYRRESLLTAFPDSPLDSRRIAHPLGRLLVSEMRLACCRPFILRRDSIVRHGWKNYSVHSRIAVATASG
jgi:hypothetical protein